MRGVKYKTLLRLKFSLAKNASYWKVLMPDKMNTRTAQSLEDLVRWIEAMEKTTVKPQLVINVFGDGLKGYRSIHVDAAVMREMMRKLAKQNS